MAAAVRLAMNHLAEQNGDRPIHLVGYSNGAALAVQYALSTLDDTALPRVDSLVLLSPQIGVTPAAAMAIWQARLGRLVGLEKLAWNDILPEYDPFKYGSFAVNAGNVSYRLTAEIQRHIGALQKSRRLDDMPPVLAFSSVVDSTVLAPALISNLFNRLSPGGHELVLFDVNTQAGMVHLMHWNPDAMLDALQGATEPAFTLRVAKSSNKGGPPERTLLL
jgi:alpha-beta hydrolase superfamily lysophospholipase